MQEVNDTYLVLIPKVLNLETIEQFLGPIDLCNFHNKVIARIITNRMKNILDNIVDESQSAFTSGRLITDNILVPHEMMHFKGKDAYMAMKLNKYKAYDRAE